MLISLHMPKTAGSSFLASLRQEYGPALMTDYGDRPINHGGLARNAHALGAAAWHGLSAGRLHAIDCIHGHFMPVKYTPLGWRRPTRFITWLRDPVERLGSHYHYWMRHYNPHDAGRLHRRVVEEEWTLERFCLGAELQNTYCKFLWGFPLERFAFVGITEYYEQDLEQFAGTVLGRPVEPRRDNVNPEGGRRSYFDDSDLRGAVERHHARDLELYHRALAMREQRRGSGTATAPATRSTAQARCE